MSQAVIAFLNAEIEKINTQGHATQERFVQLEQHLRQLDVERTKLTGVLQFLLQQRDAALSIQETVIEEPAHD